MEDFQVLVKAKGRDGQLQVMCPFDERQLLRVGSSGCYMCPFNISEEHLQSTSTTIKCTCTSGTEFNKSAKTNIEEAIISTEFDAFLEVIKVLVTKPGGVEQISKMISIQIIDSIMPQIMEHVSMLGGSLKEELLKSTLTELATMLHDIGRE